MSPLTLMLLAVGVSADAFAVALGKGLQMRVLRIGAALALALSFGLFQAGMPLLGWYLGSTLADYVTPVDHWIAFGLLAAIGGKMIHEALTGDDEEEPGDGRIPLRDLIILGIATSIDAFAAGIGMAFMDLNIYAAVALIGVVTFLFSIAGVLIGHRAGLKFRGPAEIVGGLVLIAIGFKVLSDHLGIF